MRLLGTIGCMYIAIHCFRAAYILGDWVLWGMGGVFIILSFIVCVPIYVKVENGGNCNDKRSS